MTSFYGSSFTNDYNSIKNTPIKNLKGTSESPIILSELSDGIYFFDGDYKISDADTALNRLQNKAITIETDVVTSNKTVTYIYVSEDNAYLKIIIFNEEGTYSEKDELLSTNPVILVDNGDEVAVLKF